MPIDLGASSSLYNATATDPSERLRAHTVESPCTIGNPCGVTSWLIAMTSVFSKIFFCTSLRYGVHFFGVIGGLGLGFGEGEGEGDGDGEGEAEHLHVWFLGGSGVSTLHETPCTPSHVNVPRQPIAHIVPSGKHPNVFPSTHSVFFDNCLVHAQEDGGDSSCSDGAAARTSAMVADAEAFTAVQFMIGVVKSIGEAKIAHIENSVIDSSNVTFGGPSECEDVIRRAHVSRKQRATASRGH